MSCDVILNNVRLEATQILTDEQWRKCHHTSEQGTTLPSPMDQCVSLLSLLGIGYCHVAPADFKLVILLPQHLVLHNAQLQACSLCADREPLGFSQLLLGARECSGRMGARNSREDF